MRAFVLFVVCFGILFPLDARKITVHSGLAEDVSWDLELVGFPKFLEDILISDFEWLASIPYHGQGSIHHQKIFGGPIQGKTYITWLKNRIYRIDADLFPEAEILGQNPIESPMELIPFFRRHFPFFKDKFSLTWHHFSKNLTHSSWERISTILHETHHGDGYYHVKCVDPRKMPKEPSDNFSYMNMRMYSTSNKMCDETEEGPYGVEAIFLLNLAKVFPEEYSIDLFAQLMAKHIISPQARQRLYQEWLRAR